MAEIDLELSKLGERVAKCEQRLSDLIRWQETQNGHLKEINNKIDKLFNWLILLLGMLILSLSIELIKYWT